MNMLKEKIWPIALLLLSAWSTAAAEHVTYFHNDGLGSPVAATNDQGEVLWTEAYDPYGIRLVKPTAANRLWYTGKSEESDLGLTYFGARWYEPGIGRFHGIDPKEVELGDIYSFNRYAYANNNPFMYVDPDGRATTVITIIDPHDWDHSASHIDNPSGLPMLYDPAGAAYFPKDRDGQPLRGSSQDSFEGKQASLKKYVEAYKKTYPDAEVQLQRFDTTPEQEAAIAQRIKKQDMEGMASPGQCTSRVKDSIIGIGPFKEGGVLKRGIKPWTVTPSGLHHDLSELNPSSRTP